MQISKSTILLFYLLIIAVNSLLIFFSNEYIISDKLYYNSFQNNLTIEQVANILDIRQKYAWSAYAFQAIILFVKINFTAFCVYVGFSFLEIKVKYIKLLFISLISEGIFIFYSILRLILLYFKDYESFEQIQSYWPLSCSSIFSDYEIPTWFLYPMYSLNIAQVLYYFLIALGISYIIRLNYKKSIRIVLLSYGMGHTLWILAVVYFQVYLIPSASQ